MWGRLSFVGTALSKQSAIQHVLVDGYVTAFTVVTECPLLGTQRT